MAGPKKLNFPKPGATKEKEPMLAIDAARMLVHWNQSHPDKKPAQRVTDKIVKHTGQLAVDAGWAGAAVVKDAISGHTSGMVLLRQKKTTITPDVIEGVAVVQKPLKIKKD